jgi:predicted membrane protein (TIGR00267 family)
MAKAVADTAAGELTGMGAGETLAAPASAARLAAGPANTTGSSAAVGQLMRNIILGGQDGLVNVLGLVLGVASATSDTHLIMVSGLAATFAESISMGAVAYTSSKAESDYYHGMLERERRQIAELPHHAREDIRQIYLKKGFKGEELEQIVDRITADTKLWLDTMMLEELRLLPEEHSSPAKQGLLVGVASVIGSLVPVIPFVFLVAVPAMVVSTVISVAVLFGIGVAKARVTGHGSLGKNGLEMAVIGTLAGIAGYAIGLLMGAAPSA